MSTGNGKAKTLGVFALAMINVAAVLSLRNYPSMAVYGWSSIGWYVIGTIAFFIPLTLAGAELATGWPKGGGVYAWVKEAFGEASGFIAVFCELTVMGTLAIAIVVPVDQLNLAAGLMQAFQIFLQAFNLTILMTPLALLVALGGVALLASWLIGPALGLGEIAAHGNMPPFFGRLNKRGAPAGVLLLQAVIGTVVSMLYLFIPSISAAYWVLSALTVLLLCIVYLFVFAALIKLRYSQPNTPRAFKIPGGKAGAWIVGGVGFLACVFTFIVSLLPPGDSGIPLLGYALIMLVGTAVLALPPLVFLKIKKPSWMPQAPEATATPVSKPAPKGA